MIKQIIAGILALFTAIFSWFFAESKEIDWQKASIDIIEAIKVNDIDTIEGYMCQNIKDNVPELRAKIAAFIGAIEGDIISYERPSQFSSTWNGNVRIVNVSSDTETTSGSYHVGIRWVIANPSEPETVGIVAIWLSMQTDYGWKNCGFDIEMP